MSNAGDPHQLPGEREVREAYRALGSTGPDEALDARVHSAVAAELQASGRRRRASAWVPWATAASVLLAAGLGYRAWREAPLAPLAPSATRKEAEPPAPPAGALEEIIVTQAERPVAQVRAREPAPARSRAPTKAPAEAEALAEVPAQAPAGVQAVGNIASDAAGQFAGGDARRAQPAAGAAATVEAATAPAAPPPPAKPRAAKAGAPPVDRQLVEVRRLLAVGEHAKARDLLLRWRADQPGREVPEDLASLLSPASPPLPAEGPVR